MGVDIATFPDDAGVDALRRSLREVFHIPDRDVSVATIGAHGEPFHDHRLMAAWVPRQLEVQVRDLVEWYGGAVHEPAATVVPPRPVIADRAAISPQVDQHDPAIAERDPGAAPDGVASPGVMPPSLRGSRLEEAPSDQGA